MGKQKKCRFYKSGECLMCGESCNFKRQEECDEYEPPYEDADKERTIRRKNDRRNKQNRDYEDD